jgi:DNA-binding transcriptional ArsR family regulator
MAVDTQRRRATLDRFKAMSHPLRAELLMILTEESASPAMMARRLGEPVGNVSYHVNKLVKLGCAEQVGDRPVRGAIEHFFRATERHLVDTEEWEELQPELKEHLSGEFAQKIVDDMLLSLQARILGSDKNFCLVRTKLVFDDAGRQRAIEIHERARLEIEEEAALSTERMAATGEAPISCSSIHGCFALPPQA